MIDFKITGIFVTHSKGMVHFISNITVYYFSYAISCDNWLC